jgi:hypothetical protein
MKRFLIATVVACAMATMILTPARAFAQVIVDDSWASGTRTSPPNDAGWWYSTSSSAIEVGTGFLGLVTGGSGRGIHGTFASQALGIGDTLTATFMFTTPETVGTAKSTALRAGLFDTTGHSLAQDISASSGSPNALYNNLDGYMTDWDVNTGASADTAIRVRSAPGSGQLLATTSDYTSLGDSPDAGYSFLASTSYVGIFSITRTGLGLDLTSSLYQGATLLDTFTISDPSPTTTTFGMIGFHANSSTFGSSSTPTDPGDASVDNGINFTNVKIEYTAIPEPSALALTFIGLAGLVFANHRRRH